MNVVSHSLTGLALVTVMGAARPAAATPIINFDASTMGCFTSSSCTPTQSTITEGNLNFTGATDTAGSIDFASTDLLTPFNLGQFWVTDTTGANANINLTDNAFDLLVTFTDPTNAGQNTYSATLDGKITGGPNNTFAVDFSQTPLLFNFSDVNGSGQFQLAILNDPAFTWVGSQSDGTISPSSVDLNGEITLLNYQSASDPSDPAPVPEPASLVLLGTGLLGTGAGARRFRRRAS